MYSIKIQAQIKLGKNILRYFIVPSGENNLKMLYVFKRTKTKGNIYINIRSQ